MRRRPTAPGVRERAWSRLLNVVLLLAVVATGYLVYLAFVHSGG
jgi:hypothetical protein